MADDKTHNQPAPRPGDVKPFGAGVQPAGGAQDKADADKADREVTPKTGGQGHDGPRQDETVPGGAYVVDGKVLDANGNERKDYEVQDGKAVRKGDTSASRKADDAK